MFKYNKEELKKELTLEQIYDLLTELGAEPILKDNCIICKTICHNSDLANASHKLYYYSNTHLFHCYTGCGDASFDIYDLVLRVNKTAGIEGFSLSRAISFVARYFGYTAEIFDFEDSLHRLNADAHLLAGNYEQETLIMLIKAFKNAKILDKFN